MLAITPTVAIDEAEALAVFTVTLGGTRITPTVTVQFATAGGRLRGAPSAW